MPGPSNEPSLGGPLGTLPGFTYDPVKKRYFPTPPSVTSKPARQGRRDGLKVVKQRRGGLGGRAAPANGRTGSPSARPERPADEMSRRRRGGFAGQSGSGVGLTDSTHARHIIQPLNHTLDPSTSSLSWRATDSRLQRRARTTSSYGQLSTIPISNSRPFESPLTAIASLPERQGSVVGDDAGGIHALRMEVCPIGMGMGMGLGWEGRYGGVDGGGEHGEQMEGRSARLRQGGLGMSRWVWQEINLSRKVTGLQIQDDLFIATTFGPSPRLFISPLPAMLTSFMPRLGAALEEREPEPETPSMFWEIGRLRDCWGMSAKRGGLVMGGNGQVVHSSTVFDGQHTQQTHFTSYSTIGKSDALSVAQLNKNEALAGLRSSYVVHFDFRLDPAKAGTERCCLGAGSSVFAIKTLGETFGAGMNVIASAGGDELSLWDLRWTKGAPVVKYKEHVNDYRQGLGLAVNPTENVLSAAGSDNQIRAWDLASGIAISPSLGTDEMTRKTGPYSKVYDTPVTGIDFTEEGVMQILHGKEIELYAHPGVVLGL